jgi:hypothetical protein
VFVVDNLNIHASEVTDSAASESSNNVEGVQAQSAMAKASFCRAVWFANFITPASRRQKGRPMGVVIWQHRRADGVPCCISCRERRPPGLRFTAAFLLVLRQRMTGRFTATESRASTSPLLFF